MFLSALALAGMELSHKRTERKGEYKVFIDSK